VDDPLIADAQPNGDPEEGEEGDDHVHASA
jgi:hypothetical protein